ncbi:Nucleotidyltransferase domain-containing protein [Modestobacter sp. DSM 44400]|uniref:nucleotidyltransferase domain-containing protein n=1 Tax=Modestobacter sp. DSM 44400 TaxID=1550230 RepID=UPI00089A5764|nr:nucleotidyltransferase domain-containing protein [Modestobacter sp. DSM 44400]SDY05387.1 Nucleotidyltransferase domain-containing protein [Modestobacter sp. DSM 44400]
MAADPAVPVPLSGPLGRRVSRHRQRIKAIAASYGAGPVRVFGSVARGSERADSDIDLLLDLPERKGTTPGEAGQASAPEGVSPRGRWRG